MDIVWGKFKSAGWFSFLWLNFLSLQAPIQSPLTETLGTPMRRQVGPKSPKEAFMSPLLNSINLSAWSKNNSEGLDQKILSTPEQSRIWLESLTDNWLEDRDFCEWLQNDQERLPRWNAQLGFSKSFFCARK